MALEIFKLVGSIFIDTDKANESLQKTDKKASNFAENMGKAGKVAAGAAVAIGTAIVGAGTAMVGMANDASKTADEIDKASTRMGIGTEQFQELKYAAEQSGVELATLESAAKKLEGTDLNLDQAINQIMSLQTAEERSAMAADLFGEKLAYTLSPLIEQSGEDLNGLRDRAHELGLVMSEEAVRTGTEYGDLSADLQKSFGMLKTNLGSALFPVLNSVIKKLIEFMPKLQEIGQKIGPIASDFVEKLLPPLVNLVSSILPSALTLIGSLLPALAQIADSTVPIIVSSLQELLPVVLQVVSDALPVLVNIIQMLAPILGEIVSVLSPILSIALQLLSPLLQLVSAVLTPILGLLTAVLTPLLELASGILTPILSIISALLTPLTSILSMILQPSIGLLELILEPLLMLLNMILPPLLTLLQTGIEWLAPKIAEASDFLTGFFNFLVQELRDNLPKAFEKFSSFIKGFWEGLKGFVKDGINFYIRSINTLLEGLNKIKPPEWLAEKTGIKGVNFSTIPLLAEGGIVTRPGSAIVGEEGPELLNIPAGASVVPLNQAGIDYERLTEAFVTALRLVAPELRTVVSGELNTDNLVRFMVRQDREARMSRGRGLFEA
ncbi:MAG: hypothetical protein IKE94_02740 [Aeriscardovia sp.]|nr:hypothetical protein [Aeriscardovia sp.]